MRSLLNLAGVRNGGGSWQVIEEPGGDVVIVDVDNEDGETRWRSLREGGYSPIALTRRREFAADHVLHKPLRSREFLELLDRVTSGRPGAAVVEADAPEAAESLPPTEWVGLDQPEEPDHATLAEHLRRQTWTGPVVLEAAGWPRLVIDPGSGSWFYDGSIGDMTPKLFSRPMAAGAGRPVSSADLVDEVESLVRRPLSELKWFAGLAQSRGKLHPDLLGETELMLTQAPGEAMKHERFARLARILIRAPLGIDELHRQSGEAPENIAAFLNACYTTGRLLVNRSARVAGF
ncbi:MAG: hypothetical protein GVY32_00475 [Gammaproteobacteria bacterium]|jgi:hypothetical protein|nr:hypothetical protein [Gammaproteobacteria bacterium]